MADFEYISGDPDNLTGGGAANMVDIQGPLIDLREFLQTSVPLVARGQVASTGAIVAGSGYTVVRSGTGVYAVTLASGTLQGATGSPVSATAILLTVNALATTAFEVRTFTTAGAAVDSAFSFVAVSA